LHALPEKLSVAAIIAPRGRGRAAPRGKSGKNGHFGLLIPPAGGVLRVLRLSASQPQN